MKHRSLELQGRLYSRTKDIRLAHERHPLDAVFVPKEEVTLEHLPVQPILTHARRPIFAAPSYVFLLVFEDITQFGHRTPGSPERTATFHGNGTLQQQHAPVEMAQRDREHVDAIDSLG